jgi:lysophospholipid acyltransferase (LPLAT)-like uncharacterized protein
MKLTNPALITCVSWLASGLLRAWLGTLDIRVRYDEPDSDPVRTSRRNLYLFWHEIMLLPAYTHARFRIAILVSRHRDGELIAQIVRMMRGVCVRGSTDRGKSRGGATAMREMIRRAGAQHLAITPDGPRGPRRQVQGGAVYLASRTGMPLVPSGFAFEDPWRAGSWDRMALPRPFRRARGIVGKALEVPPDLDREGLEAYRVLAQKAMDEIQDRAERAARGEPTQDRYLSLEELVDV